MMGADDQQIKLEWLVGGLPQVEEMAKALGELAKAQEKINKEMGVKTKSVNVAYEKMIDDTTKVKVNLEKSADGAAKIKTQITEVAKKTEEAKKQTQGVLLSWTSVARVIVGSLISRGLGKLLRMLGQGARDAIEFEIRISELRTISQHAQLSFNQWSDAVRNLSNEFNRAPLDVMEGLYQTLSNQVAEGAESTLFLRDALRLSLITVSSTEEAVQALTATINAYGYTIHDARYISDVFFKTVELGRLRLGEIANTIGRVEVLAAQLGITFEELVASLDVLTIQGVRASEAETWLRNVMLKLIRPTDKMRELFESWGVASGEAAIETFGFAGVIEKLYYEVTKSGDALDELGEVFNRIRATTGAAGLVFQFKKLNDYLEQIKKAGPDAAKAFDIIRESAGYKLQNEFRKISNFFIIDIGRKAIKALYETGEAFGGLANITKYATAALATYAAIAGGVAIVSFAKVIGATVIAMYNLGVAVAVTTGVMKALNVQVYLFGVAVSLSTFLIGAMVAAAIGLSVVIIREMYKAKMSIGEAAAAYREKIMPALYEWYHKEAEINADRVRMYKETADTMKRIFLQRIADETAAVTRLRKIESGRYGIEEMIFDLRMRHATASQKQLLIAEQSRKTEEEIYKLLALNTPEAVELVKDKFSDLLSLYNQMEESGEQWVWVWKEANIAQLKGNRYTNYGWQLQKRKAGAIQSERELLYRLVEAQKKYNETYAKTSETELLKMENLIEKNQERVDGIELLKIRYNELDKIINDSTKQEIENLGTILSTHREIAKEILKRKPVYGYGIPPQQQIEKYYGTYKPFLDKLNELKEITDSIEEKIKAKKPIPEDTTRQIKGIVFEINQLYAANKERLDQIPDLRENVDLLIASAKTVSELAIKRAEIQAEVVEIQNLINEAARVASFWHENLITIQELGIQTGQQLRTSVETTTSAAEASLKVIEAYNERAKQNVLILEEMLRRSVELNSQLRAGTWSGGYTTRFASGGSVGSDTVHALLSPGEFVINKNAARQFFPQLVAMNSGVERFNTGGSVINNNIGDINVTVKGGDTSEVTVRRIGASLRREIRRGTIRLD